MRIKEVRERTGGSSPRAWGTLMRQARQVSLQRFIPTGVGNTSFGEHRNVGWAVHPHGRGEHARCRGSSRFNPGSSPRAWGTRAAPCLNQPQGRFIPTGVGNTACRRAPKARNSVHPHGRGEHGASRSGHDYAGGSSPRAWGTPHWPTPVRAICRFIPTGVGNTTAYAARRDYRAVHPHGRGEHCPYCNKKLMADGSSPRAWGTLLASLLRVGPGRFIPTGVGNTSSQSRPASCPPGSSPRAWGTRPAARRRRPARRFIPTGVGNTN